MWWIAIEEWCVMESNEIMLYVVYSLEVPELEEESYLKPIFSPMQNYSELYIQKSFLNEGVEPNCKIGFFHMRRYLDLSQVPCSFEKISRSTRPYHFRKYPLCANYSGDVLTKQMLQFDIIAPIPENIGITVRARYGQYSNHRSSDLERVVEILLDMYPEYRRSAEVYLSGSGEYYGNLYIMSGRHFTEYATWLFEILSEFDRQVTDQLPRTPGYLSERLFGIWLTYQIEADQYSIGFLPRVHFYGYDGKTHHFRRDAFVSKILPPGSRKRYWVRKLLSRIRQS